MRGKRAFELLRRKALEEMDEKIEELERRIGAIEQFRALMDGTEVWDWVAYARCAAESGVEDYGDEEDLAVLIRLLNTWPSAEEGTRQWMLAGAQTEET